MWQKICLQLQWAKTSMLSRDAALQNEAGNWGRHTHCHTTEVLSKSKRTTSLLKNTVRSKASVPMPRKLVQKGIKPEAIREACQLKQGSFLFQDLGLMGSFCHAEVDTN